MDFEKVDILVISQKVLKVCFQMPYENLPKVMNNFLMLFCHLLVFLNGASALTAFTYQLIVGIEDVYIIWESLIAVCDYIAFVYVFICFRIKLNELKEVLSNINNFLDYCSPHIIKNAEKQVNFYTKCFLFYIICGLVLNNLIPSLNKSSCMEQRHSDFYRKHDPCGLPLRNLFPFDADKYYAFVYIFEVFNTATVCFGVFGITMTLIGLLIHIIDQIRNCRNHIERIFDSNDNETIKKEMHFCIKYHQLIRSYTEKVYAIFNLVLMAHIFLTSLIFGVMLYLIVSVETYNDKLRYMIQLAGWIAILFMTCFYGQQIIIESTAIGDVAYNSLWYNGPIKYQRNIQLMIIRGQKPLILKCAGIAEISLEAFVGVMKTAYSFFALLITISK